MGYGRNFSARWVSPFSLFYLLPGEGIRVPEVEVEFRSNANLEVARSNIIYQHKVPIYAKKPACPLQKCISLKSIAAIGLLACIFQYRYLLALPIYNSRYWVTKHGKQGLLMPCIYTNYSLYNMLHLEVVTRHNFLPWGFIFIHYLWKLILRSKWSILRAWFSLDYTHFFMKDDSITLYDICSPEQIKSPHYYEFQFPWYFGVYFILFWGHSV